MKTFDQFLTESALLNAIAQGVRKHANRNPVFKKLAQNEQELQKFLMLAQPVIRQMSAAELDAAAKGPEGFGVLLNRMVEKYLEDLYFNKQKPNGQNDQTNGNAQNGNGQTSANKLIQLLTQALKPMGKDPRPYIAMLQTLMRSNPNRVDAWASSINTPEEMLAKMSDWQKRGKLG